MNIEWLVADVTAVGSLDRAKRDNFGVIVAGRVLANSGHIWAFLPYMLSNAEGEGEMLSRAAGDACSRL